MGVKISELTQAMAAQDTDVLPIVQNGETKKITKENLFNDTETEIENLEASKVNKTGDTMTGDLNMQGNSVKFGNTGNIQWKEDGYGDKFRIMPDFNGTGSNNKLVLQSTIGGAGEDPSNWINIAELSADNGDLSIKGKLQASNINTQKQPWGSSMSFNMIPGQHALVMISQEDCLMIWVAGFSDSPSMNFVRLYGNSVQVSFNGNTVTINYGDSRNFTGNAIIL